MPQAIMQFGLKCLSNIKAQLENSGMSATDMTLLVEPIYGRIGTRVGITIHTKPSQGAPDAIGYRIKIGFSSKENRASAHQGIEEVHQTIKGLFDIQNDAAWVLRDKNTNDVWFTFSTRAHEGAAFIDSVIDSSNLDEVFLRNGRLKP